MRFLSITYRHFGPFDERTLDVSAGKFGLHVIYGPNEAGKTTALRGLGYLLFGFDHRKTDDFRFKHSEQRIGAKLVDSQGLELEIWRRRGTKNTLLGGDDKSPVADEQLRHYVGALTKDQFEMLFGLGHDRLRSGGAAIVAGQGGLGKALFEAVAGLAGLPRIEQQLREQLLDLYKKQGQNPAMNAALAELKIKRQDLQAKTLQIEAWTTQEEALRSAQMRQGQLEAQRKKDREELQRLEAFKSALPVIDALRDLEERLEKLQSSRRLDEGFAQRHRQVVIDLHKARQKLGDVNADVERLTAELAGKRAQNEVIAEAQAIERLKGALGVCLKAEADRAGIYARMREHRGAARTIMRSCFKRDDLENAESLRVSRADQDRIRELAGQRLALLREVEGDVARIAEREHEIGDCERQLAALADQPDLTSLAALVRDVEQQGPLEKNRAEACVTLAANRRKAEAALQRLSACWRGTLEDVAGVAAPPEVLPHLFVQRFAEQDKGAREVGQQLARCEQGLRESRHQIEKLLNAGPVPSEAALLEARDERDAGVRLVRSGDPATIAAFIAKHAAGMHLADALQAAIDACDTLADAIRHDAKRVSEVAIHEHELRHSEEERKALNKQIQAHAKQAEELAGQWTAAWQASGVTPKSPTEMTAWLQQWARLREQVEELAANRDDVDRQAAYIEGCKVKLRDALAAANLGDTPSLAAYVALAAQRLKEAAETKQKRNTLDDRLRERRLALVKEVKKKEQDEEKLKRWYGEWGAAVSVIALDATAEPTTAHRYLEEHDTMFAQLREAGTIELRLKGMDRDREQFLTALTALRRRLENPTAPDSSIQTMAAEVDAIVSRYAAASEVAAARKLLTAQLAKAQTALQEAKQTLIDLEAKLHQLRDQAGVAQDDEIPDAIDRANRRRDMELRIEDERSKLRPQARGQALEQFLSEALAARATLDDRIASLNAGVEPLNQEINQLVGTAATASKQLESWRGASSEAADCQQEMVSLVETLRGQAQEYTALHLARQVLKRTIERFRKRHEGHLLPRAAHFFRLLTNGAFEGLEVDETEKGEPVLLARRTNPQERVAPADLSDGTRDQLFLALRLAGIEQHLEQREPMPLVVDDVLIHFDADRARATLECLAEMSRRTQVLLFTHHAYLVDLTRTLTAGEVVFCHELGKDGDGR